MGAIKDLVDLVTQLSNSVEDRKFASELRQIQGMIGGIQSEHAAMHEQRIELMTENASLKQTISSLEQKLVELQREITNLKNTPTDKNNKLSEEAEKILLYLAKQEDVSSGQIAHSISLDLVRTEYWLGELSDKEFIYSPIIMGEEPSYFLAQGGRGYLIKSNLI
jgi:septal ring factor EnvC (AmiA/AmiB activator)